MTLAEDLGLPANLLDDRQLTPAEDVFMAILRQKLAPLKVTHTIPVNPTLPLVLVRRLPDAGYWDGDPRGLIDVARMSVHVYCDGLNAEAACIALSEIVRRKLHDAWREQWHDPTKGALVKIRMITSPSRQADWATSSGPVQYADLPNGAWRYETHYVARIRPPL